jgi:hypothetical protein
MLARETTKQYISFVSWRSFAWCAPLPWKRRNKQWFACQHQQDIYNTGFDQQLETKRIK